MKQLKINTLLMKNIKGIENLELNFTNKKNFVIPNGKGKSTVLDTIMWLLTGQTDLQNRKFDPLSKTLDGKASAELCIEIDGVRHDLTISMSQKDELVYMVDGKVLRKTEYTNKLIEWGLKDILLTSNPLYLLNYLTWQEARELITSFITPPEQTEIENYLNAKYITSAQFNSALGVVKQAQWDKDTIKLAISNLKTTETYLTGQLNGLGSTLAPQDTNFDLLKVRKAELEKKRLELENVGLKKELQDEVQSRKDKLKEANDKLTVLRQEVKVKSDTVAELANKIAVSSNKVQELQSSYNSKVTRQVNDNCSTCGHTLSEELVTAMRQNLYAEANAIKDELDKEVQYQTDLKAKYVESKAATDAFLLQANQAISFYTNEVQADEYAKNVAENKLLTSFDTQAIIKVDNELLEINKQLALDNDNIKAKMVEIQGKVTATLLDISVNELALELIEQKTQYVMAETKRKLKDNFPELEIVLDTQLKNGTTKPNFTVSYLGVEYKDLNTAAKIKAGIIFANGMQNLLKLQSPILIDNFEAVDGFTAAEFNNYNLITMSVGLAGWNA